MYRSVVSTLVAILFVSVAVSMSAAAPVDGAVSYQPVGLCNKVAVDGDCAIPPCYRAVLVKKCFKTRTVFVPCGCECCVDGCGDNCVGAIKTLRVGCKRFMTVRICDCCPAPLPEPAPVVVPEPEPCPIPCYKIVCKKGCFGKARAVLVPCCCDECDGPLKTIRVGCKRYKTVRICTSCP